MTQLNSFVNIISRVVKLLRLRVSGAKICTLPAGASDDSYTEVIGDNIKEGEKVLVGIKGGGKKKSNDAPPPRM